MTNDKTAMRRRYSAQFKAQGINTNVVHRWRKQGRQGGAIAMPPRQEFVPIRLALAAPPTAQRGIEVEVPRGPLTMNITRPTSAAADFACWSRELLR